jgi:uncharacterized protein
MTLSPKWRRRLVESPLARIVTFILLAMAFMAVAFGIVRALGWTAPDAVRWQKNAGMLFRQIVPILAAYLVVVRFIEKRCADEIAWRRVVPDGVLGFLGGALLLFTVIGALWLAGFYRVTGYGSDVNWATGLLVIGLGTAVAEEIVFRGILYRITEEGLGFRWAIAISALFFGGVHIGNTGATLWTSFAIAVEAGVLLGVVYHVTRSLPACIGLHMAWNFLEGTFFGSAVSGVVPKSSWLVPQFSGPEWLTGGAFGIEGSVLTVVLSLGASAALLAAHRRRTADNVSIAAGAA